MINFIPFFYTQIITIKFICANENKSCFFKKFLLYYIKLNLKVII
jgi:hypothetical protein